MIAATLVLDFLPEFRSDIILLDTIPFSRNGIRSNGIRSKGIRSNA